MLPAMPYPPSTRPAFRFTLCRCSTMPSAAIPPTTASDVPIALCTSRPTRRWRLRARQLGQRLHAALALGNELKQLEAVLIGDRLGDRGELDVEVALGIPA
jgi:hypothetical protein